MIHLLNWEMGAGQRRRDQKLGGRGRSEEKRCYAVSSKEAINERFVLNCLPPDVLTGWPALPKPVLSTKIWLAHSSKTFFYQTKIWRMDNNHNCKYHNFVKTIQPRWGWVRG